MSFTDDVIKKCPHCNFEASVKHFGTWEKNGKRGLLGKTPEGFIMFLCPNCENIIKYDTISNEFLFADQKSKSGLVFILVVLIIIIIGIYLIVKVLF